ncbi:4-amino-4-deoxy-L-arabinose transferase [Rhizobiales bacterium GAS191]|nr:4-amino-4-deoxy-L-arabinose transferase [Rhizobiales bacterium GAS191]
MTRQSRSLWELPFLALLPLAAVLAFKISVVNHFGNVDPWLYTGLARNIDLSYHQYGQTYYAVRFPVILPLRAAWVLFGDIWGYIVIHYLAALLLVGSIYALARRTYGPQVAAAASLFVAATPIAADFLAWDYVNFLVVPYMTGAISLWLLGENRRPLYSFASGFLACCAIASHAFVAIGLGVFYLSQVGLAIWRGRSETVRCAASAAVAACGFALCAILGWLAYRSIIGPLGIYDLLSTTIFSAILVVNSGESWSVPFNAMVLNNYNIYVPLILLVATIILIKTIRPERPIADMTLFSTLYIAVDYIYSNVLPNFTMSQPYYFVYLSPAIFLLAITTLGELGQRGRSLIAFSASIVVVALCFAWLSGWPFTATGFSRGSAAALIVLCAGSIGALTIVRASRSLPLLAPIGAASLAAVIQASLLTSQDFSYIFGKSDGREWSVYQAGATIADTVADRSRDGSRVLTWVSNDRADVGAWSSGFVNFWSSMSDQWSGDGMPAFEPTTRNKLLAPDVKFVLLVSGAPDKIESGIQSMRDNGFSVETEPVTEIGNDAAPVYSVLAHISAKPRRQ